MDPSAAIAAPLDARPSAAALAMIDRLIAFPTVSRDSNLGLIEYARDYLAKLGVKPHLVYDVSGKKASLFCTLADDAERLKTSGLILSGHTDTVPVDGQEWASDPFKAHHQDGRIHGRGSADMKGFIAVALAWAPQFLAAQHKTPIHLALTYDEETSFLGVRGLVQDFEKRGVRPAACIIGEPTDMRVIVAHKGKRDFCCRVRGREAHSSLTPIGVNAVEFAARIITFIRGLADEMPRRDQLDSRFDIPYTTVQTGAVQGGTVVNIVPRDCEFLFEMRNLATTSTDELFGSIEQFAQRQLLPAMRAVAADADIRFETNLNLPAFGIAPDTPLVQWAMQLARTAHMGAGAVGFATEAGTFMQAGIPTVVLGPGSIAQAHRPNEYLSYEQVTACEQFFQRLIGSALPRAS